MKLTPFVGSKDEWDIKKDPGKSMKNVLYTIHSSMAKGTSWAEATSNSKKIKLVALAIVELRESEGIIQSVRWLVSYSVSRKFHNIILKKNP